MSQRLAKSFSHVPGRCSTSFTSNLEHITTFFYFDSFYRLDLYLPRGGISKICSHIRTSDFALLITLGRLKKFTSVFCLLKGNSKDVHKRDLFWLPLAQDYSTVKQPRVCLLHCRGTISLILPSQETYSEETQAMLPHRPGDFITDVEQFFSITITIELMSFSVFAVAWPIETVLQSKLRGPFLCSSCYLLWTDHKSILFSLSSFLVGNDLLNSLVKHPNDVLLRQSGAFHVQLWASQCLFLCQTQHYIVAFRTQTQGSLRYSFKLWIHPFIVYSYGLEQSVLSGWVLRSKCVVCVFTTILKFKSVKVFNSVIPKLSQTAQEILPQIHKVL